MEVGWVCLQFRYVFWYVLVEGSTHLYRQLWMQRDICTAVLVNILSDHLHSIIVFNRCNLVTVSAITWEHNLKPAYFWKIHSIMNKVQRRKALFHLYSHMPWQSSTLIKLDRTTLEKHLRCVCKYVQVSLLQFAAYQEGQTSSCAFI